MVVWFFSSFPSLENSVIWCQMTAIVFATRALRKERRAVCVITSSLIWKLPGDSHHSGDSEDAVFRFGRAGRGFLEEVESENSGISC